MPNIKYLIILLFIVININASMQKDIVYVENLDSNEISLKDEFFNEESKLYTISLGTLNLSKQDSIDFFKTHKLSNALSYKYGKDKKFAKVISGVYQSGTKAMEAIKKLDPILLENKPYSSKLIRHQRLYKENSLQTQKKIKKLNLNQEKNSKINEIKDSIYSTDKNNSEKLKEEFLNPNSKYYSLAIGTIKADKNSIEAFFNNADVEDKAIAHLFGKNKEYARVVYGLYKNYGEAKEAIDKLNATLKSNKPFPLKMENFQNFYKKYNTSSLDDNKIIKLKVNEKKSEKVITMPSTLKLDSNIKIIKKENIIEKEKEKKDLIKKEPSVKKEKKKKILKNSKVKKIAKEIKPRANKFLKNSKLEDVYYIESEGSFNILSEVFLNEKSSFYTVDLGELKLDNISIEDFFIENRINDDALAYKYGKNKEFARIVYGAFETKNAAKRASENINFIAIEDLRVSNIKKHQKLYKEFHKESKKISNNKVSTSIFTSEKTTTNFIENNLDYNDRIVISENSNILKEEFFNRDSNFYTITLLTFLKSDISPEKLFSMYDLDNNVLAYPIGTENYYYRVITGYYKSSKEARNAINNLPYILRKNVPYVSKISTNQKKFESYNNRKIEAEINRVKKIQFNIQE